MKKKNSMKAEQTAQAKKMTNKMMTPKMMLDQEIEYAAPWMMICIANPTMIEGRKLVGLMDRILQEKTPKAMKAWM